MPKQKVIERLKIKNVKRIQEDFLETEIDNLIEILKKYKEEGWQAIESTIEYDYDNYAYSEYYLYKYVEESDEAYDRRLEEIKKEKEKEKIRKLKDKESRRKMYEKLKKEFGE